MNLAIKGLVRAFTIFQSLLEMAAGALLVLMTVIVFVEVVLRYVFSTGLYWSNEIALLCMVWYGFLSIAFGIITRQHIIIEAFTVFLPKRILQCIDSVQYLAIAAYGVFVVVMAKDLCGFAARQSLPATKWPYSVVYASLVLSGALFALYGVLVAFGLYDKYLALRDAASGRNPSGDDGHA
jgi:TRAP-type C4-dicarboxylate transport system permease small subunit